MAQAFLVGRILVGGYFLAEAFRHFTSTATMARYAGTHGVPAPELAVIFAGLLLLVGGVSVLLGVFPRIGVAAIVLFLVPVTLIMPANIGLLGSTLMFLAVPRPWPYSVERRLHLPVRAPV
jgi:putative oxidoreductase